LSRIPLQRVLVEEGARAYPLTRRMMRRLSGPVPVFEGSGEEDGCLRKNTRAPSLGRGMDKKTLRLVAFPGELLKPCPGTGEGYICCGYQILNVGTNCPLDCSYCILQAYMNLPSLRVFVNLPEALPEIARRLDEDPSRIWRIGTGEFTDSLALDPIVGWHEWLLPFFDGRKNAVLELKTKTDRIRGLLASPHRDRIIVSWSLNSPWIATREEHKAPTLELRIRAAARCQKEGFVIGFHFDPLVRHPGWREGYQRTLDLLDRYIAPKGVIWVSLGAMRYMPGLKRVIRTRHPGSAVLDGEFTPGLDGKMRYFKPIRTEMYGVLRELLTAWHPNPGLYLCMERDEVWEQGLGWSPGSSEGLAAFLDDRVKKLFPAE